MVPSPTPASRPQANTAPPATPSTSHPPSRQSTRITTPVRNNPNFVRPSNDSPKALPPSSAVQTTSKQSCKRPHQPSSTSASTLTHATRKPKKAKVAQKLKKHKSKRVVESSKGSETESSTDDDESSSHSNTDRHGTARMMDFTQDSDNANHKLKMALRYPGPVGGPSTRVLSRVPPQATCIKPPDDQVPIQSQGIGLDISGTRHQLYPTRTPPPTPEPSSPHQSNHPLTDAEELDRARKVAANAVSSSYNNYHVPELSDQKDKSGRFMIAYHCKMCSTKINRPMSDSSCGNLNKHAALCLRKQQEAYKTHTLASVRITGTGGIDPKEVP
ncbi:hypothetical protein PGTUg99_015958 [Puccinia graminis f. sp. tritici]|uniref:BED-type domain-containing protein n=1 Tax=Puccinia graminis f. sp. tritici TaxID=56615 RepID=A0A5B0NTQ6_PUCGR|nr:hypothetical protein PGTUg99_015958 [Puccinia graminis f. sp. tritici]